MSLLSDEQPRIVSDDEDSVDGQNFEILRQDNIVETFHTAKYSQYNIYVR